MEIRKRTNDYGHYDIEIENDFKLLSIYQGGDDPNISCRYVNFEDMKEGLLNITFDISDEHQELYRVFSQLFNQIIDADILGDGHTHEMSRLSSTYENLVQDGIIVFKSDDYPVDCPNILRIIKNVNKIRFDFEQIDGKPFHMPKSPYGIKISIRQSGSRYAPFNIPFNRMFLELQNIEETKNSNTCKVLKK